MDADTLLSLMNRRSDDPSVEETFAELRTRRRPALDSEDRDAYLDWVLARRQGVELGFVDEVFFQGGPKWRRRRKDVSLILYQIYFYSKRDDILDFIGELPFGLKWSNDRATVRQKLSAFESTARYFLKDTWDLPGHRMIIDYKKGDKAIDSIVCELPLHPWPEEGRIQPVVSIANWVSVFGLPATSPTLRERLQPLDLAKRLENDGEEHEVDFIVECGLELNFTEAKRLRLKKRPVSAKSRELVFGAARFLRSRELDGREWKGELPFGLKFDDTQKQMLEKMGRKPDQQQDEDFSGFALWHLPELSLHILYSNMANHLLRVMVMAPGYWSP